MAGAYSEKHKRAVLREMVTLTRLVLDDHVVALADGSLNTTGFVKLTAVVRQAEKILRMAKEPKTNGRAQTA